MPRGRKRKVLVEASGGEEEAAMGDVDVEEALAQAEAAEQAAQLPKVEKGEIAEQSHDGGEESEANDMAPPPEKLDVAKAQEMMSNLDVLVCGKCHFVFHFVEELMAHKKSECSGVSEVISNNTKADSKAQVWAFILFKANKLRERGAFVDWNASSWQLYQKWSNLSETVKRSWVEAGRALQQLHSYLPPSTTKTSIKPKPKVVLTPAEREQQQQTLLELQKELEDDTETQMMSTLGLVRGKGRGERDQKPGINQIWRKSLTKLEGEEDEEELYTVEKIVAKRVNPKSKQPEYLVKWLGFPSDQNTWEQIHNMASCMKLVQEFEKNLARQKARKALEASKMAKNVIRLEGVQTTPGGRPVRTSALKALDQVKEWVGGKRAVESEEDSNEDEPAAKRQDLGELMIKKKGTPTSKSAVIVASSRGVVRVDHKHVPNLSSGVYILSTQQGLVKVDESTASRLSSCAQTDGKKITQHDTRPVMINDTEVRRIPASQATPKIGILRKDLVSGIVRKENSLSPAVNILQRVRPVGTPARGGRGTLSRQIILGSPRQRPLPGPVPSPLRPPMVRPKVTIKQSVSRPRQQSGIVRVQKKNRVVDEDFEGGMTDEFPKDGEPVAPSSPSRPLTLCPMTGRAEGEKTPPHEEPLPEVDEDGMMRVAVSPGGSIHQVVAPRSQQRVKQQTRSLLTQRRAEAQAQAQAAQQELQQQHQQQKQELISIESEDGVIYQITPEQQQLLMQNGTLTMDAKQQDQFAEHTEILIENGQIMERRIMSGEEEEASQDEQTMMLAQQEEAGEQAVKEGEGEEEGYSQEGEGMLTLDSAVQEAVSQGGDAGEGKGEESQMVAQIVQAEPPTPGGGPRKVVLLLPDGSLLETEMEEEQYQALEFEK